MPTIQYMNVGVVAWMKNQTQRQQTSRAKNKDAGNTNPQQRKAGKRERKEPNE
jgi:hypothetical protein